MTVDIAVLAIRIDSTDTQVATKKLDQLRETGSRTERSIAGLDATARSAASALKLLATVVGANEIVKQADLWASLEGRLRLVTNTERQMIAVRQQLYDMSQRTRGELEGTVDLYTKLTRSTQSLSTTEAQRLRVTESINKMMVISSATSEEAAGAIRQLGQAMGSGVLRGDELNRILESAPRLAEAIAAGMGRSTDEVRAMGAAGEITSKALIDSLLTQSQAIDDEFGKMPKVVGQAMVQIQNSFLRTIGVFDQTNQLSANLANTLSLVAENMGVLAAGAAGLAATAGLHWVGAMVVALRTKIAVTSAAIIADRAAAATIVAATTTRVAETAATVTAATARLAEVRAATMAATGNVQLALTTNALIPAQQRAAAAALAHAAALNAQRVAGAGAAGVAGWGARAMGLLGGPIGIITTLLGLGATAWMMWGQKAEKTATDVKVTLADATEEIIIGLDKQIKKIAERNRLMGVAPEVAKAEGAGAEQQRAILAEINRIAKDETLIAAAKTEQLRVLGGQYNDLTVKMELAAKGQAELDKALKGDKRAKWLLDNSQYMNEAQKLAAAIAKAKTELGDAYTEADKAMITAKFNEQNIKKAASAFDDAKKSAQEYIESLKIEGEELGKSESQLRLMRAAREAAKAPTAALAREILFAAAAFDKQAIAQKNLEESQERAKKGAEAMEKIFEKHREGVEKSIEEAIKEADKNEELARTFGMTKGAIEQLELARLQEQLAQRASTGMTSDEIAALEKLIEAKKRSAVAMVTVDGLEAQKKVWESIDKTAHDTFISIFDSGKNAFDRLRDTLKNGLLDLLYQMTIKKWIFQIAASVTGSGVAGAASAQAGSAVGSAGSSLLSSALGGASLFGAGGLAGSMMAGAGWLTGATTLGGSLAAAGSLAATGTLGGIASSLGMVAGALGPIALGIGAAVAIWKKLDTSGTYHTGGASSASSAGARTIRAESLHFEATRTNSETEKMTAALASGIVGILDSTALAFGKTAGYTAATAFADDTSRDGAWGGLVIDKLGAKILDWQDTKTGSWAPKVFADGAAGQEQYLAAVSKSVRTALDGIGLPAWAKTMLDGVGAGASIDELAKVVDTINVTQRALVIMGNSITGFAQLGDRATSALIAASGGIEALAGSASAYYDAFYSEGEKSASTIKQIKDALAAVNIAMPATQEAFRAQVEAQMKLGEAGAPAVAVLLKVAGAFAQVTPQMEAAADAARSAADILGERNDLQKQLDQLTLSSTQLLLKQRNALDASNRGLFDQIQAAQKAKDAQDAAKASLGDFLGQMKSFADTAKGLNGSLLTGSMSTLTPEQQYAETSRQLDQTLAAIRAGDTGAQGNLKAVEDAFLAASMKSNAGDSVYASDFARVLKVNDEISQWATGQIDTAQASLNALNAQVIGISDLNASMLSVADAINGLPAALGATPPAITMPAPVLNYSTMGTANTEALVAEVKRLNARIDDLVTETKGRREDAKQQTGDQIESNYDATQRAAQTVVDATVEEGEKTRWTGRRKVAIER